MSTPSPVSFSTHSLASRARRCRSRGLRPASISLRSAHLLACRPNLSGNSRSADSSREASASTTSGPTFSAASARAEAWSRVMSPSANFSLTFGMSDSRRATVAIRLDSRRGRRAFVRRTSTGSEPESASDTVRVTSHIIEATRVCIRPSRSSVRSARWRGIGPISTRSNWPRRTAIRSSTPTPVPSRSRESSSVSVAARSMGTNICSFLMILVVSCPCDRYNPQISKTVYQLTEMHLVVTTRTRATDHPCRMADPRNHRPSKGR